MMRHFLAAAALLVTVACNATGPRPGLVIATDASSYAVRAAGWPMVHFVATNHSDRTLYIQPCLGGPWFTVEVLSGGIWVDHTRCFTHDPPEVTPLPASAQLADSLSVATGGEYRITVSYAAESRPARYVAAYSNEFTVIAGPPPIYYP